MSHFHKIDDVIPESLVYDIDLILFFFFFFLYDFKFYNDDVIPVMVFTMIVFHEFKNFATILCHKSLYDVGPNDVIPGRCYSSKFLLTMLFHDDVMMTVSR
jgi:hypothetical protein